MRQWLRDRRLAEQLTQEEVAKHLGLARAYYTQIELGNRRPSPEVAQALGRLLHFSWTIFFDEKEDC